MILPGQADADVIWPAMIVVRLLEVVSPCTEAAFATVALFVSRDRVSDRPGFFAALAVAAISIPRGLPVLSQRGNWMVHDPTCKALPSVAPESSSC